MKKLLFVMFMMSVGSLSLMAQSTPSCAKTAGTPSCCAKKSTAAAGTADTQVLSVAERKAAEDETISKRVCAESGAMSFYKKEQCATSGKISYSEVKFDEAKQQFVNVSPNDIGNADGGNVVKAVNVNVGATENLDAMNAKEKAAATKSCDKEAGKKCCAKPGVKSTEGSN